MAAGGFDRMNHARFEQTHQVPRISTGDADRFVERQHPSFRSASSAKPANLLFADPPDDKGFMAFRRYQNFLGICHFIA